MTIARVFGPAGGGGAKTCEPPPVQATNLRLTAPPPATECLFRGRGRQGLSRAPPYSICSAYIISAPARATKLPSQTTSQSDPTQSFSCLLCPTRSKCWGPARPVPCRLHFCIDCGRHKMSPSLRAVNAGAIGTRGFQAWYQTVSQRE